MFGQKWLYWAKWLYSGKSFCIRVKMVVFLQKLLYSGKSGCIGQSDCILVKVFVFGQNGCIPAKVVVFGQSDFLREEWLYSVKVVVFG